MKIAQRHDLELYKLNPRWEEEKKRRGVSGRRLSSAKRNGNAKAAPDAAENFLKRGRSSSTPLALIIFSVRDERWGGGSLVGWMDGHSLGRSS